MQHRKLVKNKIQHQFKNSMYNIFCVGRLFVNKNKLLLQQKTHFHFQIKLYITLSNLTYFKLQDCTNSVVVNSFIIRIGESKTAINIKHYNIFLI